MSSSHLHPSATLKQMSTKSCTITTKSSPAQLVKTGASLDMWATWPSITFQRNLGKWGLVIFRRGISSRRLGNVMHHAAWFRGKCSEMCASNIAETKLLLESKVDGATKVVHCLIPRVTTNSLRLPVAEKRMAPGVGFEPTRPMSGRFTVFASTRYSEAENCYSH